MRNPLVSGLVLGGCYMALSLSVLPAPGAQPAVSSPAEVGKKVSQEGSKTGDLLQKLAKSWDVPRETMQKDREVVSGLLGGLSEGKKSDLAKSLAEKKVKGAAVRNLLMAVWFDLRCGSDPIPFDRPLRTSDFTKKLEDFVKVTIESEPAKARVYLRTPTHYIGLTPIVWWVSPGKVRIILKNHPHESDEEVTVPDEGIWTYRKEWKTKGK